MSLDESIRQWVERHRRAHRYAVEPVPWKQLDGWSFRADDGDLVHRSGGFFSVHGVQADRDDGGGWTQPIIRQTDIGVLGVLATTFDGVPHVLLQAKMEPGNAGMVQVSPTVQATRSNFTRLHRGAAVPYLDFFLTSGRGRRTLSDALQSEQGSWFWGKRNRNIVVFTTEQVPVLDGFRWFSLPELHAAIRIDNLVNMDTRTALAGLASVCPNIEAVARHPTSHILSLLTAARADRRITRRRIPLRLVRDWRMTDERIEREDGRFFRIFGVRVEAGNREVPHWSQPVLAPAGRGLVAFAARRFDGRLHVLMHLRRDVGTFDAVELAPTVMCLPANYDAPVLGGQRPPYLDAVLTAPADRRLIDVIHSEEGGRFYHACNRYLVTLMDDDFADPPAADYVWVALDQLAHLVRYGNLVDVGARCLLTCLTLTGHHLICWSHR